MATDTSKFIPAHQLTLEQQPIDMKAPILLRPLGDDPRPARARSRGGRARDGAETQALYVSIDLDVVEHGMESRVTLVPVTLSKGLEFDHVVVVEPATIVSSHARGLNWLYVALTRAVTTLTVVHAEPLPDALASGMIGA